MVYPHDRRNEYFGNDIFISAWSSELLVSTLVGNFQDALNSGASDGWASRSLFVCVIFFFLNFDAGVPSCIKLISDEE